MSACSVRSAVRDCLVAKQHAVRSLGDDVQTIEDPVTGNSWRGEVSGKVLTNHHDDPKNAAWLARVARATLVSLTSPFGEPERLVKTALLSALGSAASEAGTEIQARVRQGNVSAVVKESYSGVYVAWHLRIGDAEARGTDGVDAIDMSGDK